MPPAVAAVAGAVVAGVSTGVVAGLTAGIVVGVASLGLGLISQALAPKPSAPRVRPLTLEGRDRTTIIRSSIEPQRLVYGEAMVSGPLVAAFSTGNKNEFLHLVIPVAGHRVESIGNVFFNDVLSTDARFSGLVRINKHLGSTEQAADTDLVAEVTEWTTAHRLRGIAYTYVRLKWDQDVWVTGIPNIKAVVKGKHVWDPRVATVAITSSSVANPTVITTSAAHGLAVGDMVFISGHAGSTPVIDGEYEVLSVPSSTTLTIAVNVTVGGTGGTTSKMAWSDNASLCQLDFLASPFGINPNSKKIHTGTWIAAANISDELVNIGVGGVGGTQKRYTADGVVFLDSKPLDIMEDLLSASAGTMVYQQGQYRGYAGAFTTATIALDENDLRDAVRVQTKPSRQETFNAVRGVFVDKADFWQPKDFPPVTNSTFEAEDNNRRLFKDLELPFTTDIIRAQRIAKIFLERSRQSITVNYPAQLSALELATWDTVQITNTQLGWTNKVFRILTWTLSEDGGVDLVLQEEASTVYDWNGGEETVLDPAPNTTLPNPFAVDAPVNLTLLSGSLQLLVAGDGTVFSRIKASWDAPTDQFVVSGGRAEIQFKKSADANWEPSLFVSGDQNFAFISPVKDGINYDVRVRLVNVLGGKSPFTTVTNHTVIGKTDAPADVTGFSASQNGDVVNFSWTQVADSDLAGYEIRFGPRGQTSWADATPLTEVTRGTAITNAQVPPGDFTFFIKAMTTSGTESVTEASADAVIIATLDIIKQTEQSPNWLGTLTSFVRHQIIDDAGVFKGVLVPDSTALANSFSNFEVFDQFVPSPVATATYEAPQIDVGFDDTVRVWGSIVSALGPGVSTGSASPKLQMDSRLDAGAFGGFKSWTIGNVKARFIKLKLVLTTADGLAKITGFLPTADLLERTEGATSVTIAAGGTAITFAQTFHLKPRVSVIADSAAALIATKTGVSTTGFTAHVFNTGGTDVGGVADWSVIGV